MSARSTGPTDGVASRDGESFSAHPGGLIIRLALAHEILELPTIEKYAGQRFLSLDMAALAYDPPPSPQIFVDAYMGDRLWVACITGQLVGYGFATIIDGHAHLEQTSVHPDHAGHGIGRQIIEAMCNWAATASLQPVTLTTFAHVPWNAPYYRRFGFVDMPDADAGPELVELLAAERASDLGHWQRICMVKTSSD